MYVDSNPIFSILAAAGIKKELAAAKKKVGELCGKTQAFHDIK